MKIRTRTHKYHAKTSSIKSIMGAALEGHIAKYITPLGNLIIIREEIYLDRISFLGKLRRLFARRERNASK